MEEEEPLGISLSISPESDDVRYKSPEQEGGDLYISISHALIYSSYIYLHTLLFRSEKRKDRFAKHVLVEA